MDELKLILGIDGDDKDELLSFVLSLSERLILSWCRIDEIPEEIGDTKTALAARIWRRGRYGQEFPKGDIKTISEGERSVSYESFSAGETEDMLAGFYAVLEPFRNKRGRLPDDLG